MRSKTFTLIGVGLLVLLGLPGGAIEIPATGESVVPAGSQKPDGLKELPSRDDSRAAPALKRITRKGSLMLGIEPGNVDGALKAQLSLDGFAGVLVQNIVPSSPADKAGIMKYDIITKVADKPIASPQNISEALRGANAGDKVTIDLLRASKPLQVELVLDNAMSKMPAPADSFSPTLPEAHIDKAIGAQKMRIPKDLFEDEEMQRMYEMAQKLLSRPSPAAQSPMAADVQQKMREIARELHRKANALPQVDPAKIVKSFSSMSTFVLSDPHGVIEVKTDAGHKTWLKVKDTAGKIIFEGPYTSEEDKAKVPRHIRERMESICINMGHHP